MKSPQLENLVLPSAYDISRVQMTGTRYRIKRPKSKQASIDSIEIPSFNFKKFKCESEAHIAYFQEKDFKGSKTVGEKILRIITSPKYRAGSLELINLTKYRQTFLQNFEYWISREEPIKFMLPAFPFKIRNPLKSSRGDADLAEVASFSKFNEINLQIQKVYAPGAQFHIFHDGHLYYRHFLHDKDDADRYFLSLTRFIEELELQGCIRLVDAFEKLKEFSQFPSMYEEARQEMTNLWEREKDINKKILKIRKSATGNLNLSDIPESVLLEIATDKLINIQSGTKEAREEIQRRADACAFEYMVVQHALEKLDFFSKCVPNGTRLTVHPKEGQIGLHLVKKSTFLLPWMGVGLQKKDGEVSVRYEVDLKGRKEYQPVRINGEESPFYYQQV